MSEHLIRVALRIRPLLDSEIQKGCQISVNVVPGEPQVQIKPGDKSFTFNHVFPPSTVQEEFYNEAVKDMIPNIFEGFNVTIIAYGQTGSGKTYSMGTNYTGGDVNYGIIPRAVDDLFSIIESEKKEWSFKVTVSFLELYQEQLYDLLADKDRSQCVIEIREGMKNIIIVGLTEKIVTDAQETLRYLMEGSACRATGATAMNQQSSRSHAVFTITVHQEHKTDSNKTRMAKFTLVDLAGSERSKKTLATGERFKEGVNINKGLLALGNVISQLGEGGNVSYVGYRDSKLTRLLQDSLGGNSMTLMIACVSPADYNLDETVSTLRYADRARKIKNKPIVNQDSRVMEINQLHRTIDELRTALMNQEANSICPPEHKNLQAKVRSLTTKLNDDLFKLAVMYEKIDTLTSANEQLRTSVSTNINLIEKECRQAMRNFEVESNDEKVYRPIFDKIYSKMLEIRNLCQTQDDITNDETDTLETSSPQNDVLDESEEKYSPSVDKDILNVTYDIDKEQEEHRIRQEERNNKVVSIDKELAAKEKLIMNLLKNSSIHFDHDKEIQDMEEEIKKLQEEKASLQSMLNNVQNNQASSKLAESRRKKIQELEKKIADLSRKCMEQTRVIKTKEKLDLQIKNLKTDIQSMKETKVKLIRQMRSEAEKFNKWKQTKERELNKIKAQNRKQIHELTRQQTKSDKEKTVLKRKVEETQAINKRLKEDLERQVTAQQMREKLKKGVTKTSEEMSDRDKDDIDISNETDLKKLRERLLLKTAECNAIKKQISKLKPKDSKHLSTKTIEEDFVTDDSIYEDDTDKDPDWEKTPLYNRVQKYFDPSKRRLTKGEVLKRSLDGEIKCSCKTQCKTRLCSCRKNGTVCKNCNCNPDLCENKNEESIIRTLFKDLTNEDSEIDAKKIKVSTKDVII